MLEYSKNGKRISFGKSIIITSVGEHKKAETKYIIVDRKLDQFFICTDDFLIVVKPMRYSDKDIIIYPKYVFVSVEDTTDFLLAYFMLIDIPIYEREIQKDKINLFGYTLLQNNIDS
jgi:hypothetical protein